jgi:hypothetical protein
MCHFSREAAVVQQFAMSARLIGAPQDAELHAGLFFFRDIRRRGNMCFDTSMNE